MRQFLLVMLLMGATFAARAEFTQYFADDELAAYLDRTSITREGSEARMWTIDDYRAPQKDVSDKSHLSVKSLWVFDCTKRRSDVLEVFYHAGPMAQGEVVQFGAPAKRDWDAIEPGSVGELAFKVACAQPGTSAKPAAPKSTK